MRAELDLQKAAANKKRLDFFHPPSIVRVESFPDALVPYHRTISLLPASFIETLFSPLPYLFTSFASAYRLSFHLLAVGKGSHNLPSSRNCLTPVSFVAFSSSSSFSVFTFFERASFLLPSPCHRYAGTIASRPPGDRGSLPPSRTTRLARYPSTTHSATADISPSRILPWRARSWYELSTMIRYRHNTSLSTRTHCHWQGLLLSA